MNILNRRYRRYASEIVRLETVIEQCLAPDKHWLQLIPQTELDERRRLAEQRLKWIRQYCESEPQAAPAEATDPIAEQCDAFVELLAVFGEGAGRAPLTEHARRRLSNRLLPIFERRHLERGVE